MKHSEASLGARHPNHNWVFSNQATREAYTILAADVGKDAFQSSDSTWWRATAAGAGAANWKGLGSAGGVTNPITADLNANSFSVTNVKQVTQVLVNLGNITGAVALDLRQGMIYQATLTGNVTFSISNAPPGPCRISLVLIQDATGNRTASLPAGVYSRNGLQPSLSNQANSRTIWTLLWTGSAYHVAATDALQAIP